ncbi:hypothetical protein Apa02nite_024160 [Actinoplanes palleronii]|uniref:Transposase n=1 Tax=Actinoplanes palleronii TaxID=113570 RepID=A0ABQ4B6N3_9ACTN|nr:hypothetical protein Apa02nite_024160 [Actinoplanes palleronii]
MCLPGLLARVPTWLVCGENKQEGRWLDQVAFLQERAEWIRLELEIPRPAPRRSAGTGRS